jgi:hypothetical protein
MGKHVSAEYDSWTQTIAGCLRNMPMDTILKMSTFGNLTVAMESTKVPAATNKQTKIEELLQVVICLGSSSRL